jgi:hypothetical protein
LRLLETFIQILIKVQAGKQSKRPADIVELSENSIMKDDGFTQTPELMDMTNGNQPIESGRWQRTTSTARLSLQHINQKFQVDILLGLLVSCERVSGLFRRKMSDLSFK